MDIPQGPRRRRSATTFTTKSGNSIKLNRSFSGRRAARKDARARQRALYLSTLPKNRWKRLAYRMHPQRVYHYWFSHEGGIMALKILGIGIVVCFLLLVGMFAYFRKDLPNITDVSGNNLPGSISYYDSSGKTLLWQDYDAVKRTPVSSSDISPYMKNATIAIEDKSFYHEGAFNVRGIARATYEDLLHKGSGLQGGSTITQQLVKLNENWTDQRTITRKIKELILAVELSREYSKNDILTGYLNVAPYGGIEYGCESAARDYFHTSCKDLSLAQAAMLASIPRYPTGYSPYSDPKYNPSASGDYFDQQGLIARQHYVLDQMVQQGMISQSQADAAKAVDILAQVHTLTPKYQGIKAPYFVLSAKHELEAKYGSQTVNRGGWRVTTTLDMNLQNEAEHLVEQNLPNVESYGGDDEAMVGEDVQTGKVVALVGGVDFNNPDYGQINFAQTNISPGSSVKPYDYVSLINFSKDVGAGSVLYDTQGALPGYPCTNHTLPKYGGNCLEDYDFHYPGPETLRYALAGSRNVPAVKAMLIVGTNKVINTADSMMGNPDGYRCYQQGVNVMTATKKDEDQCYGSSAIGDGAYLHLDDHVNGLSTLGRLGQYIPQTYIDKIVDATGHSVYQWTPPKPQQVVTADAAYIVDNMLSDPNASYLPNRSGSCSDYTCPGFYGGANYKFQHYNGWRIAVKTGTTNDNFDGLMTAWTTKYAVASWVGYHTRNKAMTAGGMEYMTEPLTRLWIQYALDSTHSKAVNWKQPSDVKTEPAFVVTSHVGLGSVEPSPSTDLYPSWYTPKNSGNSNVVIDKVSNKVATSCTPDDAKIYVTNSNANAFSVDPYVNGGYSGSKYNTNATDDVHNCDDSKPSASLVVADSSGNQTTTCDQTGCNITVTATQGTHPLGSDQFPGKITISIDGKAVKTCTLGSNTPNPSLPCTYNYTPTKDGSVTVTAEVTDSVLYQSQADGSPVTVQNSVSGNGGNNGNGPQAFLDRKRKRTFPVGGFGG